MSNYTKKMKISDNKFATKGQSELHKVKLHMIIVVLLLIDISSFKKLTCNAYKPTFCKYANKQKKVLELFVTDYIYGSFVGSQKEIEPSHPLN